MQCALELNCEQNFAGLFCHHQQAKDQTMQTRDREREREEGERALMICIEKDVHMKINAFAGFAATRHASAKKKTMLALPRRVDAFQIQMAFKLQPLMASFSCPLSLHF